MFIVGTQRDGFIEILCTRKIGDCLHGRQAIFIMFMLVLIAILLLHLLGKPCIVFYY